MAETKATPTKVVTGLVRFSYAHVFKPEKVNDDSDPKYSVALLIDKSDKATLRKFKEAIDAAKLAGAPLWGGTVPAKLKLPLRDGDEEYPDDEAYQGKYFVNATSGTKPGVVDASCDPIIDQTQFYSGCYGRASIKFYPFNKKGNRGVAVALNNVQKLREGTPLSSMSTPEEDFAEAIDLPEEDDLSYLG